MTEDEFYESDPEFQDDDIIGEFLIEDYVDDDLTLVMMPKVRYDFEAEFDTYYKLLKKCRNKEQMKIVLNGIISHASQFAVLEHETKYIQDRVKDLEFNINVLSQLG